MIIIIIIIINVNNNIYIIILLLPILMVLLLLLIGLLGEANYYVVVPCVIWCLLNIINVTVLRNIVMWLH